MSQNFRPQLYPSAYPSTMGIRMQQYPGGMVSALPRNFPTYDTISSANDMTTRDSKSPDELTSKKRSPDSRNPDYLRKIKRFRRSETPPNFRRKDDNSIVPNRVPTPPPPPILRSYDDQKESSGKRKKNMDVKAKRRSSDVKQKEGASLSSLLEAAMEKSDPYRQGYDAAPFTEPEPRYIQNEVGNNYRKRSPSRKRNLLQQQMHYSPSMKRTSLALRRRGHSPHRIHAPPSLRRHAPSPMRRRAPSPMRRRAPSPMRKRAPSPLGKRVPSPQRRHLPSPLRRHSPSSLRILTPSPLRRYSPSLLRRHSPSPLRKGITSPHRRGMTSPHRRGMTSPHRRAVTSPHRRAMTSPHRRGIPSRRRRDIFLPHGRPLAHRRGMPSPHRTATPTPSERGMSSPHERDIPLRHGRGMHLPHGRGMPSPHRTAMPSPHRTAIPSPHERDIPSPHERDIPSPHRRDIPSPHRRGRPSPHRTATPTPHGRDMPLPHRRVMPLQQRRGMLLPHGKGMPSSLRRRMPLQHRRGMPILRKRGMPLQNRRGMPLQHRGDMSLRNRRGMPSAPWSGPPFPQILPYPHGEWDTAPPVNISLVNIPQPPPPGDEDFIEPPEEDFVAPLEEFIAPLGEDFFAPPEEDFIAPLEDFVAPPGEEEFVAPPGEEFVVIPEEFVVIPEEFVVIPGEEFVAPPGEDFVAPQRELVLAPQQIRKRHEDATPKGDKTPSGLNKPNMKASENKNSLNKQIMEDSKNSDNTHNIKDNNSDNTLNKKNMEDNKNSDNPISDQNIKDHKGLTNTLNERNMKDNKNSDNTLNEQNMRDNMDSDNPISEQNIEDHKSPTNTLDERILKDNKNSDNTLNEQNMRDNTSSDIPISEKNIEDHKSLTNTLNERILKDNKNSDNTLNEQNMRFNKDSDNTLNEQNMKDLLKNSDQPLNVQDIKDNKNSNNDLAKLKVNIVPGNQKNLNEILFKIPTSTNSTTLPTKGSSEVGKKSTVVKSPINVQKCAVVESTTQIQKSSVPPVIRSTSFDDGTLSFTKIRRLGQAIRNIQEKSSQYKVIIDSLSKGDKDYKKLYRFSNSILCKYQFPQFQTLQFVIPRDYTKEFISLLHFEYHNVSKETMAQSLKAFVYPTLNHVQKLVVSIMKECLICNPPKPPKIKTPTQKLVKKVFPNKIKYVLSEVKSVKAPPNSKKGSNVLPPKQVSAANNKSKTAPNLQSNTSEIIDTQTNSASPKIINNTYITPTAKNLQLSINQPNNQKTNLSNVNAAKNPVAEKAEPSTKEEKLKHVNEKAVITTRSSVLAGMKERNTNPLSRTVNVKPNDPANSKEKGNTQPDPPLVQPNKAVITTGSSVAAGIAKQNQNPHSKTVNDKSKDATSSEGKGNIAVSEENLSATKVVAPPPKPSEPQLDFKTRIKNAQMKNKELHDIITRIQSKDMSNIDDNFVLKGGLLCKKTVLAGGSSGVKIFAPPTNVSEVIYAVHTMGIAHMPSTKVIAFFCKHFSPVKDLKAVVSDIINKCPECKK